MSTLSDRCFQNIFLHFNKPQFRVNAAAIYATKCGLPPVSLMSLFEFLEPHQTHEVMNITRVVSAKRAEALIWSLQPYAHSKRIFIQFKYTPSIERLKRSSKNHHPLPRTQKRQLSFRQDVSLSNQTKDQKSWQEERSMIDDPLGELTQILRENNPSSASSAARAMLLWTICMKTDRRGTIRALDKRLFYEYIRKAINTLQDIPLESIAEAITSLTDGRRTSVADCQMRTFLMTRLHKWDSVTKELEYIVKEQPNALIGTLEDCVSYMISVNEPTRALSIVATALAEHTGGTLELLSNRWLSESKVLELFVTMLSADKLETVVNEMMKENTLYGSMLATTFIHIASKKDGKIPLIKKLFDVKKSHNVAKPIDLHELMVGLCTAGLPQEALDYYYQEPQVQRNVWMYDAVLYAAAQTKNWDELQRQFEGLFAYDKLPNLNHYGIVMRALSKFGSTTIIDDLYNQLVFERKIKPSRAIFHAVMACRLALGDSQGVKKAFDTMENEFDIKPTTNTYLILLLSMRDQRNNVDALHLVGRMARKQVPITNKILSALLSLCTMRRDSATATALMKWAKAYNLRADIAVFNALISAYMESNKIKSGLQVYKSLKKVCETQKSLTPRIDTVTAVLTGLSRFHVDVSLIEQLERDVETFNLKPDSHYFTTLLMYFANTREGAKRAEQIFFEDMQQHDVVPSAIHYTLMMSMYIKQKNYTACNELYERMREKNVLPTFKTQEKFLLMTTKNPDTSIQDKATKIFGSFFAQTGANPSLDLQSEVLPRTRLPIGVAEPLVTQLMRKKQFKEAIQVLRPFQQWADESIDALEQTKVSSLALKLYTRAGQWQLIDSEWHKFVEAITKLFVQQQRKRENFPTVTAEKWMLPKKEFQAATELRSPGRLQLPRRYSHDYESALNARILQLGYESRFDEVNDILDWAKKSGIQPTSNNVNTVVQVLLDSDTRVIDALAKTERFLAKGYINRIYASRMWKDGVKVGTRQRWLKDYTNKRGMPLHLVSKRTVSYSTLKKLLSHFDKIIGQVMIQNSIPRTQANVWLRQEMPRTMKLLSMRARTRGIE